MWTVDGRIPRLISRVSRARVMRECRNKECGRVRCPLRNCNGNCYDTASNVQRSFDGRCPTSKTPTRRRQDAMSRSTSGDRRKEGPYRGITGDCSRDACHRTSEPQSRRQFASPFLSYGSDRRHRRGVSSARSSNLGRQITRSRHFRSAQYRVRCNISACHLLRCARRSASGSGRPTVDRGLFHLFLYHNFSLERGGLYLDRTISATWRLRYLVVLTARNGVT